MIWPHLIYFAISLKGLFRFFSLMMAEASHSSLDLDRFHVPTLEINSRLFICFLESELVKEEHVAIAELSIQLHPVTFGPLKWGEPHIYKKKKKWCNFYTVYILSFLPCLCCSTQTCRRRWESKPWSFVSQPVKSLPPIMRLELCVWFQAWPGKGSGTGLAPYVPLFSNPRS